ncbi:hypothetical protein [Kribbella sp. NPDC048915]|uniref:hypothetical protein n=1 Tax=Kribbella sp. NPDC048915 TaxID=3155148 RepID=UPI0034024C59
MSEGLTETEDLRLPRLKSVLGTGAVVAQAGSEVAANSGRWLKVTKESAHLIDKFGLRKSADTGLSTGVLKGSGGQIKGFVQFVRGPGALLTNPAVLAGAAGIMAQLAMQQAMDEITDYLATIDEKVDDVLRAQKDSVVADMVGVDFVIEEAMTIREQVGNVSEVTWSKVQATTLTIAKTQAYALRQLDGLAQKTERAVKIGDLAKTVTKVEPQVREWLAVLARCLQLQDAIAILELDRVLGAAPEELDRHRLALRVARNKRLGLIAESTENLMARMDVAAGTANAKVLLHPASAREIVQSSNHVVGAVGEFHERLGIESGSQTLSARRWSEAATEVRDKALEAGSDGVATARRFSNETLDRAKSATGVVSTRITRQAFRRRKDESRNQDEAARQDVTAGQYENPDEEV